MNGEVSFSWGSGQVLNGIKQWKIYVIVGNYLCIRKICGCKKVFFKRSFNGRQISGNEIGNELIKGNGNFKY